MGNINVHLDDNYFNKFKELKVFLECKTNEEAVEKLILLAQTQIQQLTKASSTSSNNNSRNQSTSSNNDSRNSSRNQSSSLNNGAKKNG